MLPQAIAIAELCSSMPVNGGFYWWSAALAPRKLSRPVAFIVGWFNVLSLATALAAFAYAIAAGIAETITIATEHEFSNAELMGISMGVITLWASLMLLRLENVSIVMIITGKDIKIKVLCQTRSLLTIPAFPANSNFLGSIVYRLHHCPSGSPFHARYSVCQRGRCFRQLQELFFGLA